MSNRLRYASDFFLKNDLNGASKSNKQKNLPLIRNINQTPHTDNSYRQKLGLEHSLRRRPYGRTAVRVEVNAKNIQLF